ncbi:MAG TPA: triacylglycerol lipase [Solirubrobacteraceae bacterium]|nr:triacylglycerol lipase [Solirubrobacteraceae bacterium]
MTRKLVGALAAAIALLVPAAAQAHTPILFVHGWSESSSLWTTMIGRFEKDGWGKAELTNWTYNTSQSNATTAKEVATKVSEIKTKTGATKVDLITHSMGALSTRYYIKNLGGESTIESWVSLGGPNHGTTTANFCTQTSCVEMRPNSTFLNALNAGDETPGSVRYATWWSPCDEIINPHESVILTGATNTQTECMTHVALTTNETVYQQVREFVR